MSEKVTDIIAEFDSNTSEEVVKSVEEPVEKATEPEKEAVEKAEEPETEKEPVEKAEEEDKKVEKAKDCETEKEPVEKAEEPESSEEVEKAEEPKEEAEKSEDPKEDSEKDPVEKAESEDKEETVEKSENLSDIVGALGAIMKGMADITATNNEIMKSLKEITAQPVTKSTVEVTENVIKSTVEPVAPVEDVLKSTPIVEATAEGKAVDFVQKSVDSNVVETGEVEETELVEKSIGEQAYELRKSFMPAFKQATNTGASRSELSVARNAWNSIGAGSNSERDLTVIKSFIEKYK